MRKQTTTLLAALILTFAPTAQAQVDGQPPQPAPTTEQPKYGYYSNDSILAAMPAYAEALAAMEELRRQYDDEMRRAEDEFTAKYEEFLDIQESLAPSIRQKRQNELEEYMERNVAFKKEAGRLLDQARNDALVPLRANIRRAVRQVGEQGGYTLIINTDNDACPYIDPVVSEDVTPLIKKVLGI